MSSDGKSMGFRWLKHQVSIHQVLAAYGLTRQLRQRGETLHGPCPLHGGDNPTAFRVHLERGLWHCFTACGGGDVVELIRHIEGCDHAEAAGHLRRLARRPGPTLPPTPSPRRPRPDPTAFRPFRRSIPLEPKVPFLQDRKGITAMTAERFEAGSSQRSVFLRGTVALRLHDLQGQPLGYCGRRLSAVDIERWGKWRFPSGFPKAGTLYNAHRAIEARASGVVVVECPWAAMRLSQAGITGAVALLGTSLFESQADWLAAAPRVLVLLDGDRAGRLGAHALCQRLSGRSATFVHELPESAEPEDLTDSELMSVVMAHLSSSLNP